MAGTQRLTSAEYCYCGQVRAPLSLNLPGLNDVGYYTSDNLWERISKFDEAPKRLFVLGGWPNRVLNGTKLCSFRSKAWLRSNVQRELWPEKNEKCLNLFNEIWDSKMASRSWRLIMRFVVKKKGMLSAWSVEKDGLKARLIDCATLFAVGRQAVLKGTVLEKLSIETKRYYRHNDYA